MVLLGVVAVLIGLGVLVVEAHVNTAGVLGVPGTLATAAGVGMILAGSGAALWVTIPVAAVLALAGLATLWVVAGKVVRAGNQELQTGPSALVGTRAVIASWDGQEGRVMAAGTLWSAEPAFGWEEPMPTVGDSVIISELDGLTLAVRRPHAWEAKPVWKPSSLSL